MEKSKRTFRGSYPAYALTYFFFYWSLGVVYLGAVYVSDGHRQIESGDVLYHVGFELVRRGADPDRGVYQ